MENWAFLRPNIPPCLHIFMSSCKESPFSWIDFDDNMAEGRVGSCGATLIR